jgi:hypothetical protein
VGAGLSNQGPSSPAEAGPDAQWQPGTGLPLQQFLENEIPDVEGAKIKLVEWRPALNVYGGAYLTLLEEAAEFIKRTDANTRTLKQFGRRWFRNFFRNLGIIQTTVYPAPLSRPLIITGAGPSLEESLPRIREAREKAFILAVSSSAPALFHGGVKADMVISTDGGFWALLHLYECFRGGGEEKFCLAASLSAALPSQCAEIPLLVLSDNSLWQNLILTELGIPFMGQAQRGTVTAAALDLAFSLTTGKVFIAGLDLANRDIQSHARPYSFDRLWNEKASRLNPVYSQSFSRSRALSAGGSHGIYAAWFKRQLALWPNRLHSLSPQNNVVFKGHTPDEADPFQDFPPSFTRGDYFPSRTAVGPLKKNPVKILCAALNTPQYGPALKQELAPLLFPDGEPEAFAKETSEKEWERALSLIIKE